MTPAGGEGAGDPTGEAEEAPVPPRGKQVLAAEINGQHIGENNFRGDQNGISRYSK